MPEVTQVPRTEVVEFFNRVKTKNRVCIDCNSKNPTWATVTFGCQLCLQCSAIHRNMGVHITFVRSTVLDGWSVDQLRSMKVGGNVNAVEWFQKHGGMDRYRDAKEKWTSNAAELYKRHIQTLKEADAQKFPDRITLDAEAAIVDSEAKPAASDFFAGWDGAESFADTPTASESFSTSVVPQTSTGASEETPAPDAPKEKASKGFSMDSFARVTDPSADIVKSTSSAMTSEPTATRIDFPSPASETRSISSSTSAGILRPTKKGLGAKKATKPINFEEAERKAKEAEDQRKKDELEAQKKREAEEQERLLRQTPDAPMLNLFGVADSQAKKDGGAILSPTAKKMTAEEEAMMERLGMGMGKMSFGSMPQPKSGGAIKSGGFGSTSSDVPGGQASQKFGNAKSLSSDQYFGRGAYNENAAAEARNRLQAFQGRSGFGSSEYHGRDESQGQDSRGAYNDDPLAMLGDSARGFADKFMGEAADDINTLKRIVANGGSKLSDMLMDIQTRYNY